MVKKIDIPLPIQWHEGLLLYPQHFQQQRRVFQQLLSIVLQSSQPFFWGVRQLALDTQILSTNGVVKITTLQAILPDGSPVEITEDDIIELSLQGMEEILSDQKATIYLCLPLEHDSSANARDDFPRYTELSHPRFQNVDENTGENAVSIPRLKPKLSLIVNNVPARYTSIPLCEVVYQESTFSYTDFLPPTIAIEKKSPLHNLLLKSLESLHDRIAYFVERLLSPLSHETTSLLEKYRAFYSILIKPFFILQALEQQEDLHPHNLYLELCRACGDLAAVAPGRMPARIPPYNHSDPLQSLSGVTSIVREHINIIEKPSLSIPFQEEEGIFYLHMQPTWLESGAITLAIIPDQKQDLNDAIAWIEGAIIISKSLVSQSQSRRILGAKRTFIKQDEELGLIQTQCKILLSVDISQDAILPNEELCIIHLSKAHKAPHSISLCIKD